MMTGSPQKGHRWPRRAVLGWLGTAALGGCSGLYDWVGGNYDGPPEELLGAIGPDAVSLLREAIGPFVDGGLADFHVHLVGLGTGEAQGQAYVTRDAGRWWDVTHNAQFRVMASAAAVKDLTHADKQYLDRLVALIRHAPVPGRYFLYAMDQFYDADGKVDPSRTPFYVSNERIMQVCERYPDLFEPVVSVHPHRLDALEELQRLGRRGARFVKWLPNAMGIDPSLKRHEPYYQKMMDQRMALLTHTGREDAVEAEGLQHLGNPLRLREPLEMGLTVVALHCASNGVDEDLEAKRPRRVSAFNLFMRLFDSAKYEGRLFGELAATIFFNHLPGPLTTLLDRQDLHPRMVHGSDYPLPGVNMVIRTSGMVQQGFLTAAERRALNRIYSYNPLLFDFVVKRTVRHPQTGARFSTSCFKIPKELADRVASKRA
jgi:hypothetical protein